MANENRIQTLEELRDWILIDQPNRESERVTLKEGFLNKILISREEFDRENVYRNHEELECSEEVIFEKAKNSYPIRPISVVGGYVGILFVNYERGPLGGFMMTTNYKEAEIENNLNGKNLRIPFNKQYGNSYVSFIQNLKGVKENDK